MKQCDPNYKQTIKKIEQIFEKTWTENHVNVEFQIWKKRNKIETIS